jgi:Predicted oxidoreductases of the aldo/keto reductase family
MVAKRFIPKMDREIPMLAFGCMRFPETNGKIDEAKAMEMIDFAYNRGVNYFDTAVMYHGGLSEEFVGKALKRYPRESLSIATKLALWDLKSKDDMEAMFQRSFDRLQTDYIDFYLIHAIDHNIWNKVKELSVYDFLKEKQAEGKIRKIGFSFHCEAKLLDEILSTHEFDFAQIQLNYFDWQEQDAHGQYERLMNAGIPVIAMEPIRGGGLANFGQGKINKIFETMYPDKSKASLAVRYCASLPNVATVLSGMSSMEQVKDNLDTIENFEPLDAKDYEAIIKITRAMKELNTINCTACNYCDICPVEIPIPKVFDSYNEYIATDDSAKISAANAVECIRCDACKEKCPQKIDIPERLAEIVGKVF